MVSDAGLAGPIRALLAEKLLVEVESDDTDLLKTGLIDSLALIQLLLHLEERFGVKLALDELEIEDLRSVGSIARLLARQDAPQAAAAVKVS
jgi:acyl carrier protein